MEKILKILTGLGTNDTFGVVTKRKVPEIINLKNCSVTLPNF